ncbi:MAG TPA: response regulator [Burkholderiales bacterium]|nr:response regulator [Burkholderiales bacterium]
MNSPAKARSAARILVADDDHDNVRSLLALLELEGFDARGMHTGFDVMREVQSFGADAVLLDIGMPEFDGYSVARELRKRYADATPVLIAVTGRCTPLDQALARSAGFDHHVQKPYQPHDLIKLLDPLRK